MAVKNEVLIMSNLTLDETKKLKVLMSQIKAFSNTIQDILSNSSAAEVGRYSSYKQMAYTYNDFAESAREILNVPTMFYTFNLNEIPRYGDATWPQEKMILEQALLYAKMLLSGLEGTADFVDDEFDNIENFLQSRLRTVIFQKPEKEIEVQNAIESLLLGKGLSKGVDYDRETGKFEFSGKEYIPDFVLPKMSLCIEVKLLRAGRKSRIIEEISANITEYKKEYLHQLFVVYDLGEIQNETEFKRDIEMTDGVKVVIVKH